MQSGSIVPVKAIQIRNVPDDLHRTLRARAAAAGMSLSDYALDELRSAASRPEIAEVLRRAETRSGTPPETAEIVAAIRADRDER
jgi:plasmid stability protein